MTPLYLTWQDPTSRAWYAIGRLTRSTSGDYEFVYTKGAAMALSKSSFSIPPSFPMLHSRYISTYLFPLFSNRVPAASRPDFGKFVEWLSLPTHERDPMVLLARSGGRRATDSFEVFPAPHLNGSGSYNIHFFVHGLRHQAHDAIHRATTLQAGERLLLTADFQNPVDPKALSLRTAEGSPGDVHLLGYLPRYLLDDLHQVLHDDPQAAVVTVKQVNPPPAPIQFRILCSMVASWPEGFRPCSGEMYEPLDNELSVVTLALKL